MDLQSLQWPLPSETVYHDRTRIGFGGTLGTPSGYSQYIPAGNAFSVQTEIKRQEQLEAPLTLKAEQEQSLIDTPPDVKEVQKQEEEEHAQHKTELKRKSEVAWGSAGGRHIPLRQKKGRGEKKSRIF